MATAEVAGAQASFSGLGNLPSAANSSEALAVSADGRVIVGRSSSTSGGEAFRWESGVMTGLGDLPGGQFSSLAKAVSADGQIIVGESRSSSGLEAFRWEGGVMTGLGDLPGGSFSSRANGVSADGSVIVGGSSGAAGYEAVRWSGGSMTPLGQLPGGNSSSQAMGVSGDGELLAGYGYNPDDLEAAVWQGTTITGLGYLEDPAQPSFQSRASGVSGNGSVVFGQSDNFRRVFDPYSGQYVIATYLEPFRYLGGVMVSLFDGISPGEPPGQPWTYGYALAADADGSVIVGYGYGAWLWDESGGMRDLEYALENEYGLDLSSWILTRATGVSADGTVIVGYGTNPSGDKEAWMAVIPQLAPDPEPQAIPGLSPTGLTLFIGCIVGTTLWTTRRAASLARSESQ